MDHIHAYITGLRGTLDQIPRQPITAVIDALEDARAQENQVFIMGNGGSASTASHFVCDLGKNTRCKGLPSFRAIGLTDNMAIFSAYANDEGYENVLSQQLAGLIQAKDVVIAISASGNSANVINAIEEARRHDATTIGFTGFDGGRLGQMVNIHLHVPSNIIEHVEDIHLMLEHMIVRTIRARVAQRMKIAAPVSEFAPDLIGD